MQMFAEVLAPEFHTEKNWIQLPQVAGALKTPPNVIPFIENCNKAGAALFNELTHVEKL